MRIALNTIHSEFFLMERILAPFACLSVTISQSFFAFDFHLKLNLCHKLVHYSRLLI